MNTRVQTRPIYLNGLQLGGLNRVLIQSMLTIKTSHVDQVVAQIKQLEQLGADIIRFSVVDQQDALAIREIKQQVSIPLVADIHFDYRLALTSIEQGIDKIRINPGNIGSIERIKQVVDACKAKHIPIRIGVNSGSLDKSIYSYDEQYTAKTLVASAKKHVDILESLGFYDIVLSLKATSVLETIAAYRLAAQTFPYPLHLGITEAGIKEIGIIRSVAGLAPLLLEGIGDTIRISLTSDPQDEIITAKRLLHDIGLYPNYPTLISCPTCGRTEVNVMDMANRVMTYLETKNKPITVAVMGCIVNGPGESKHADIGLAGGKNHWILFEKGQIVKTVTAETAFDELTKLIDNY